MRSLAYGKKGDQAKAAEDLAQAKKLGVTRQVPRRRREIACYSKA